MSENTGSRIIALDIGTVRIGVAASDPTGMFAQPLAVLDAGGNWLDGLDEIIGRYAGARLLVGMPRRTDGSEGPEAKSVRRVIGRLTDRFPGLEILTWDERFTTVVASAALLEADVSRVDRKRRVDKVAASVLLQSYLDANRQNGAEQRDEGPGAANMPFCGDSPKRRGKRNKNTYM